MNPLTLFRRSALLLLLAAVSLTACKKENDPAPAADLATRVAGHYNLAQLSVSGKTYAVGETQLTGSSTIARETATTVSIQVDIIQRSSNESFLSGTIDDITVSETGNGDVDFRKDGEQIAYTKKGKLMIETSDAKDVPFTLILAK
ncbi:hypothetical protein HNV11_13480 [Spirosoma taeanense]|uniref:Uncharacterized protein n=1 Tax=Spirosoma taeanense TaxID=2735870 RepID=A0A6M5Y9X0_9BACT|nr:hypothetical protein [Spirosoma taeanense]QJW90314.1 hypothetical protein HNV11_13480 [Spirosoma taeanense]